MSEDEFEGDVGLGVGRILIACREPKLSSLKTLLTSEFGTVRKWFLFSSFLLLTALLSPVTMAKWADGASSSPSKYLGAPGSEFNPIEVRTAEELNAVRNNLSAHYILMNDIDLTAYLSEGGAGYHAGAGWLPIGTETSPFIGVFDGGGFTIKGLKINRPDEQIPLGLFGRAGITEPNVVVNGRSVALSSATLKDLSLEVDIIGRSSVGGLVGDMRAGSVENCSVTGRINVSNGTVGGLIGNTSDPVVVSLSHANVTIGIVPSATPRDYWGGLVGLNSGTVFKSFAIGSVAGGEYVGGLLGQNYSLVEDTYAVVNVSGSQYVGGLIGASNFEGNVTKSYSRGNVNGSSRVGGLVGFIQSGLSVTNSFWDTQSSGRTSSAGGGTGVTTRTIRTFSTFSDAEWDIEGINGGFPQLGFMVEGEESTWVMTPFECGDGTPGNPFCIKDWFQLDAVRFHLDKHFILLADLNPQSAFYTEMASATANNGKGWEPIGEFGAAFAGVFDGGGHTIIGLKVNRPTEDNVGGLFGVAFGSAADNPAVIKNVGLVDVHVTGGSTVGGLIGWMEKNTSVQAAFVTGVATGDLSNNGDYVGGLVGVLNDGSNKVSDSYADVSVSGRDFVGGLIGGNFGVVEKTYSLGTVSGNTVGGLSGRTAFGGTVSFSYWNTITSEVLATNTNGGGDGKTTQQMQQIITFRGSEPDSPIWNIAASNAPGPYPTLRFGSEEETTWVLPFQAVPGDPIQATFTDAILNSSGTSSDTNNGVTLSLTNGKLSATATGPVELTQDQINQGFTPQDFTNKIEVLITGTDLIVAQDIAWSGFDLVLRSQGDIRILAEMTAEGAADKLTLEYGQGAAALNNESQYDFGLTEDGFTGKINLKVGQQFATKLGNDGSAIDWTVIAAPSEMTADLAGNYVLAADIANLGEHTPIGGGNMRNNNDKFGLPGGTGSISFTGKFDGLGHVISGLGIQMADVAGVGLFGVTRGALIQNIGLVDVNINITKGIRIGALIGYAGSDASSTQTKIYNTFSTGSVKSVQNSDKEGYGIGGLVGTLDGSSIKSSYSKASVEGLLKLGGLLGDDADGWEYSEVLNSFATGDVTGTSLVSEEVLAFLPGYSQNTGGLIGLAFGTVVERSYATGNVKSFQRTGGLIGSSGFYGRVVDSYATGNVTKEDNFTYLDNDSKSGSYGGLIGAATGIEILRSYATGNVTGIKNIGGLVGEFLSDVSIKESFATGNVNGTGLSNGTEGVGGLVGYLAGGFRPASVSNSYATGSVTGSGANGGLGGLVGFMVEANAIITNSYSLGEVFTSATDLILGGLVGNKGSSVNANQISNSYWNTDLSGLTTSAAGEGKTTAEMQELPTFGGPDASTRIWNIAAADGLESSFPTLRWTTELAGDAIWVMPKKVGKTAVAVSYDNFLQEGGTIGVGKIAGQDCVSCVLSLDNETLTFTIGDPAEGGSTGIDINDFPGFREGEVVDGGFDVSLTISSADSLVIDKAFTWDGFKLTLAAAHDIKFNAVVTAAGTSQLDMKSGYNFNATAPSYDPDYTVRVKLNNDAEAPGFVGKIDFIGRTGAGHLAINGNDYTLIAELGTAADKDAAGNMTLQGLAHESNMAGYFALSASIDAAATATVAFPEVPSTAGYKKGFMPIGEDGFEKRFRGGFDGLGQVVSNLFIQWNTDDRSDINCVDGCDIGLFGYVESASDLVPRVKIQNIGLTQVAIDGGSRGDNVGALIGASQYTDVSNTFSTGAVSGSSYIGGLIGDVEEGSVDHSFSTSTLSGKYSIGGLIGYADDGSLFSDVFASGNVIASGNVNVNGGEYVGGLVGQVFGSTGDEDRVVITRAYATGDVTSTIVSSSNNKAYAYAGGLIGYANYLDLSDSYATGTVIGKSDYVGGLIGSADYSTVTGSHATGSVEGDEYMVGGLIGFAEEIDISDSYSSSAVSGNRYVGGLIGSVLIGPQSYDPVNRSSIIRNSHATGVVTAKDNYVGGLIGASNYTDIIDSYANGEVNGGIGNTSTGSSDDVGGLIGAVRYGKVVDAYALGNVRGISRVGGLIGEARDMTEISRVYAEGSINAYDDAIGGLIGQARVVSEIKDAHAKGNVVGRGERVGGLIGRTRGTTSMLRTSAIGSVTSSDYPQVGGLVGAATDQTTIHQSFATGVVRGRASVGGLVGYLSGTSSIHDSYASGAVQGSGKFDEDIGVGGLVGQVSEVATGEIKNTYSLGQVTGTNTNVVGGLIGLIENGGSSDFELADNYWNMETSGLEVSAGGEGRTNGQMQSFATYHTGESPWNILRVDPFGLENPYPVLRWTTEEEGQTVWLIANNLNDALVQTIPNQAYTGSAITPELVLTDGSSTLVNGVDYELSFEDNINVGTAKVTISSVEGGKYLGTVFATFEITPIQLTVASQELQLSKSYDGNMSALIDLIELDGILAGDEVTVTAEATYDNANVGTGKTITVVYSISGPNVSNYLAPIDLVVGNAEITKKQLEIASQELTTEKVFDGNDLAAIEDIILSGIAEDEVVTVSAVATYDNANAGTGKTITVVYTLAGDDADNYLALVDFVLETGVITAKKLPAQEFDIQDQVFTGSELTVTLTVKDGDVILEEGVDYEITYTDNINTGTAELTVTGIGNYAGTLSGSFEITARSLNNASIENVANQVFTGSELSPALLVKDGTMTLEEGKDYTVVYSDNINEGTATVTLTGIGNYAGTLGGTFEIVSKSLDGAEIGVIAAQTYTGSPLIPTVTVNDGTVTLVEGVDYEVTYTVNTNAGTATVTVTGIGNYTGTLTTTFEIEPKSMEGAIIESIVDQTFTGSELEPKVTVKDGSVTLVEGTDYEVTYSDNVNVGTATLTITGVGNYSGTLSETFEIVSKSLESGKIGTIGSQLFTGSELEPAVPVTDGSFTLVAGVDYTVSYADNINTGTATVTVTGIGNYKGTLSGSFEIVSKTLEDADIESIVDQTFTGSELEPKVTLKDGSVTLEEGVDYELTYSDNINSGTATVTITGIGNYAGTLTTTFEIVSKSLEGAIIESIVDQTFTGSELDPKVTVKDGEVTLVEGTDYEVTYSDNINVGTATVTITGIGNYAGSLTDTFEIVSKSLEGAVIEPIDNQTFTGAALEPKVTVKDGPVTLVEGIDYEVNYSDNTDTGTAAVAITGIGNYKGTLSGIFEIVSKSLEDAEVGVIAAQTYTGSPLTPTVTVKDGNVDLIEGRDYEVTYSDNTNAGTAIVTVTGIGNYAGTLTSTFEIVSKSLQGALIEPIANQTFTGVALEPKVAVKDGEVTLSEGTDYEVTYSDNINSGTATVTITGIGNYAGSLTDTFEIVSKSLEGAVIEPIDNQTFTGSELEPKVTVKDGSVTLVEGTDYEVTYSDNVNVGTATLTITGVGNYSGTLSETFEIVSKSLESGKIGTIGSQLFTGSELEPAVPITDGSFTLEVGVDYTVSYANNINKGTATATVTGIGNYQQ